MSERLRIPLVLACELQEAERLLRAAGVEVVEVTQTKPPRALAGPPRVVRQRFTARGVQLVVAPTVPLLRGRAEETSDGRAERADAGA